MRTSLCKNYIYGPVYWRESVEQMSRWDRKNGPSLMPALI
nr:MAG TPA_asm: hypothetical protein [Bacteriophage sp.]